MIPSLYNIIVPILLLNNPTSSIKRTPTTLAFLHPKNPNIKNSNNTNNNNPKTQRSSKAIRNFHKNVRRMKPTLPPFWRNSTILSTNNTSSSQERKSITTIHHVTTSHQMNLSNALTLTDDSVTNLHCNYEHNTNSITLDDCDTTILLDSTTTTTTISTRTKKKEETTTTTPSKKQSITFYTYTHPVTNITYHASNTPKSKFLSYISYILNQTSIPIERITQTELFIHNETNTRNLLRTLWKQGRLLTDSTEILAFYASDRSKRKRGNFLDYLYMYVDRFISILQDNSRTQNCVIKEFLMNEYGRDAVASLEKHNFYKLDKRDEQIEALKPFLVWFRQRFPYYYDRCDYCGVSVKETPLPQEEDTVVSTVTASSCNTMSHGNDDKQQQQQNNSPFLGYIYPSPIESKQGKASRTELYHCPYCSHYTRFPRYNAVSQILTMDKGRCGEYSMLLYQFLSSLGFSGKDIRWVVDWSDHVWVEILLSDGEYVHLDPCEAIVDHKLLYQEWGKKQTYIIAFSSPDDDDADGNLIEDVTKYYTTDSWVDIQGRRDEDENVVSEVIMDMQRYMIDKLNKI